MARDGAIRIDLDVLPAQDCRDLLRDLIGGRVDAEPEAAGALVAQCARLPLALRLVAELAVSNPGVKLADLVTELADTRHRLDILDAGGDARTALRAVFSWSYRTLSPAAADLFRLLGLHPPADFSTTAAASLAGIPTERARPLLAELTRAHLITETCPDRYAFHDLLRGYAAELAASVDTSAAQRRMLDHYLNTAHLADRLLHPHRPPIDLVPCDAGVTGAELADHRQAMAWFAAEQPTLIGAIDLAAGAGLSTHAWQLAWSLVDYFHRNAQWQQWASTQRVALDAAQRGGDRPGEAHAHRLLGLAHLRLGSYDAADGQLREALAIFVDLGDRTGQAFSHRGLGRVYAHRGRYGQALDHARQTLELFLITGDRHGQANILNAIGWYHSQDGDHEQALRYCQRALAVHTELGDRFGEANTWDSLGHAHHHLGHRRDAIACYQRSIEVSTDLGDRYGEADTLTRLGDSYQADGDAAAARRAWQHGLTIFERLGHRNADQVRRRLHDLIPAGQLEVLTG